MFISKNHRFTYSFVLVLIFLRDIIMIRFPRVYGQLNSFGNLLSQKKSGYHGLLSRYQVIELFKEIVRFFI